MQASPRSFAVQMISVEAQEWEQTRKEYCELIAKQQQLLNEANSTRAAADNVCTPYTIDAVLIFSEK